MPSFLYFLVIVWIYPLFFSLLSALRITVSPEQIINVNTSNTQDYPKSAALKNGTLFVVVWQNSQSGSIQISGEIFHANGSVYIPEFPVSQVISSSIKYPVVSPLISGDAFVVAYLASNSIIARVFNSNGTAKSNEITVTNTISPNLINIGLSFLDSEDFVVGWADGASSILVSRHESKGVRIGMIMTVYNHPDAEYVFICSRSDGKMYSISWDDANTVSPNLRTTFHTNFSPSSPIAIISHTVNVGKGISSTFLNDTHVSIAYACYSSNYGICVVITDTNADIVVQELMIINKPMYLEIFPSIASLSTGYDFIIIWASTTDNIIFEIKAMAVNTNKTILTPEFSVSNPSASSYGFPNVIQLYNGEKILFVWNADMGGNIDIYASIATPLLCKSPNEFYFPIYGECLPDCNSSFTKYESPTNYCEQNCSSPDQYFLPYDRSCNQSCPAIGYQENAALINKKCIRICSKDQNFFPMNNSCVNFCPKGYNTTFEHGVSYCRQICTLGEFYYVHNESCQTFCDIPFQNITSNQLKICNFPCSLGQYYYSHIGHCDTLCNESLGFKPENNSNYLFCNFQCQTLDMFYYKFNQSCSTNCSDPGFSSNIVDSYKFCEFRCPINQSFHILNLTCTNTCSYPFKISNLTGYAYCTPICNPTQYLFPNGSCTSACSPENSYPMSSGIMICNITTPQNHGINGSNNTNNSNPNDGNGNGGNSNNNLDLTSINETSILSRSDSITLANYLNEILSNVSNTNSNLTDLKNKVILYMNVLTNSAQDYLTTSDNSTMISLTMFDAYFIKVATCEVNNTLLKTSELNPEVLLKTKDNSTKNCSTSVLISLFIFNSSFTNTSQKNSSKSIISLSIIEENTKKDLSNQFTATLFMKNNDPCPEECSNIGTSICQCDELVQFSYRDQITKMFSSIKLTQLDFNLFLNWRFYEDPSFFCMLGIMIWYLITLLLIKYKLSENKTLIEESIKKHKIFLSFLIMHPVLEIYFFHDKRRSRSLRATLYFLRVLLALSMASIFTIKNSFPSLEFEFQLKLSQFNFVQFVFPYFTYIPIIMIISHVVSSPKIQSSKPKRKVMYGAISLLMPLLVLVIFIIAANQTVSEKIGWIQVFSFTMIQDLMFGPLIALVYQIIAAYVLKRFMINGFQIKKSWLRKIIDQIVEKKIFLILHGIKKKPPAKFKRTRRVKRKPNDPSSR